MNDGSQLRKGERRMLEVLARSHPARRSRAQIGTLAGFTPSGGTFRTYWGTLRRSGFAHLGEAPRAPLSRDETLAMWRSALRAGERSMLDVLVETTASGGTFSTYLGTLRRNGLWSTASSAPVMVTEIIDAFNVQRARQVLERVAQANESDSLYCGDLPREHDGEGNPA